ncbi:hypothetical protein [Persephonella sp.]
MKVIITAFVLFIFGISFGQTIEERLNKLEQKVKQLEERLNKIEKKQKEVGVVSASEEVLVVNKDQKLISYKVLSKKFSPAKLKESLWNRSDQIVLKMIFKNNTGKEINNIRGKVVIYDQSGDELMKKIINVNKALNFFKGTTIHPGEEVKMNVEIEYDRKNDKHKKVKELPLDRLIIKFFPLKIDFADGTTKYVRYNQ